jgi:adenosylcobyric acid synthase
MTGRALMVQGTASHVGKSVLVAGLCRLYAQAGVRVAPFKAQNMSLNSAVTPEGGEIGRAQAVQADAAMVEPHVDMNPILLKPTRDHASQVVIHGRPVREMVAGAYWQEGMDEAWAAVEASFARLSAAYDLVLIEGAGSPAEVNLRTRDLANMRVAKLAQAPVLLVGDIERGGIFASLLGTLWLLPEDERRLVQGLVVNKFRGDTALFRDGAKFLAERSGVAVAGVIPYLDLDIPSEDSLSLPDDGVTAEAEVKVAVIRHPHISNFTDLDALRRTGGVAVQFTVRPAEVAAADVVILPGTKNTVADLAALRARGLDVAIRAAREQGKAVVGLCGGLQMLGERLEDPHGLEGGGPGSYAGLGLLPITTRFHAGKTTHQAGGRLGAGDAGWQGMAISGYEVHSGESELLRGARAFAQVHTRSGASVAAQDGAFVDRLLFGTYFHGIFDVASFRRAFLDEVRGRKGLPALSDEQLGAGERAAQGLDALAGHLRRHLDLRLLERLTGIAP